ncbi:MAG: nucleoside kinase, partial [Rikenellaceae bacterium]|nr:nucleoside kinase [Rikenellaceae bacterium]
METVKIRCENNDSEIVVSKGISLGEVAMMLPAKDSYPFIAAYVNNKSKDLNYRVYEPKSVRFIDATHFEGARVYQRTLFFVLYKAVRDLYPRGVLKIQHSLGRGFYFVVEGVEPCDGMAEAIAGRMRELTEADIPITRQIVYRTEAEAIYAGESDKLRLLNTRRHLYATVNDMADVHGYFYGTLATSSGMVKVFDVRPFHEGFLLCVPRRDNPLQ